MVTTIFGQIVVGPPGSGKSTYCKFICDNLRQLGRNAKIINLDPANDVLPYKPAVDLYEFVNIQKVMDETKVGPNGAMIQCIELLNENFDWLFDQIVSIILAEQETYEKRIKEQGDELEAESQDLTKNRPYFIFDCPGQSELFTHQTALRDIIRKLTCKNKFFDLRLVCMNLCDAYHASDLGKYIGLVMNSLTTMLNLALPHVNVLSKVDKIECYGRTRFNLDFYCEVLDLRYLVDTELDSPFHERYRKLTEALVGVIEDYSLVHFKPLNIQQAEDIYEILKLADRANGYATDDLDLAILQLNPNLMEMASGRRLEPMTDATTMS